MVNLFESIFTLWDSKQDFTVFIIYLFIALFLIMIMLPSVKPLDLKKT